MHRHPICLFHSKSTASSASSYNPHPTTRPFKSICTELLAQTKNKIQLSTREYCYTVFLNLCILLIFFKFLMLKKIQRKHERCMLDETRTRKNKLSLTNCKKAFWHLRLNLTIGDYLYSINWRIFLKKLEHF